MIITLLTAKLKNRMPRSTGISGQEIYWIDTVQYYRMYSHHILYNSLTPSLCMFLYHEYFYVCSKWSMFVWTICHRVDGDSPSGSAQK